LINKTNNNIFIFYKIEFNIIKIKTMNNINADTFKFLNENIPYDFKLFKYIFTCLKLFGNQIPAFNVNKTECIFENCSEHRLYSFLCGKLFCCKEHSEYIQKIFKDGNLYISYRKIRNVNSKQLLNVLDYIKNKKIELNLKNHIPDFIIKSENVNYDSNPNKKRRLDESDSDSDSRIESNARNELTKANEEIYSLNTQLTRSNRMIDFTKEQLSKANRENTSINEKLNEAYNNNKIIREQLTKATEENTTIKNQLNEAYNRNTTIRVHRDKIIENNKITIEQLNKALEKNKTSEEENNSLKDQLNKALEKNKTSEEENNSLKDQLNKALEKNKTSEEENNSLKDQLNKALEENKTSEEENNSLKDQLNKALEKNKTSEEENNSLKEEKMQLIRDHESATEKRIIEFTKRITDSTDRENTLITQLRDANTRIETIKKQTESDRYNLLKVQFNQVKEQLELFQHNGYDLLNAQLNSLKGEIENLKTTNESLNNKINEKNDYINFINEKNISNESSLNDTNECLNKELKTLKNTNENLNNFIIFANNEIETLKNVNESLYKSITSMKEKNISTESLLKEANEENNTINNELNILKHVSTQLNMLKAQFDQLSNEDKSLKEQFDQLSNDKKAVDDQIRKEAQKNINLKTRLEQKTKFANWLQFEKERLFRLLDRAMINKPENNLSCPSCDQYETYINTVIPLISTDKPSEEIKFILIHITNLIQQRIEKSDKIINLYQINNDLLNQQQTSTQELIQRLNQENMMQNTSNLTPVRSSE